MRIDVVITGLIDGRFRQDKLSLELAEKATLKELRPILKSRAGLDIKAIKDSGPAVMLSGKLLNIPADLNVQLSDGDLLAVLAPISGG